MTIQDLLTMTDEELLELNRIELDEEAQLVVDFYFWQKNEKRQRQWLN